MRHPTITENWKVPLRILVPFISTIIAATAWTTSQLWEIKAMQTLNWTIHDQREWAKQVREHYNNVPDPNEIFWKNRKQKLFGSGVPDVLNTVNAATP